MRPHALPIALRAYTEPTKAKKARGAQRLSPAVKWPEYVLVFDTETTVDAVQRLLFGFYRVCRWDGPRLVTEEEGILYADDLKVRDPAGYAALLQYARAHEADAPDQLLHFYSRRDFVEKIFMNIAYRAGGLAAGFNLPFDLSRIAVACGAARGFYRGGFSLTLSERPDNGQGHPFRPRVCVRHVNRNFSLMGLTRPKDVEPNTPMAADRSFRGNLLDLKTLAFALTAKGHTLDSACRAFGVTGQKLSPARHGVIDFEYIDYARQDVRVSAELLEKERHEFDRHPIELHPCRAVSPAAIAKAYLTAMGIKPPRLKFTGIPPDVLGYAMSGYYGGRAEVRIRRIETPVVYVDFLSMYPTVNTLMGHSAILTAEEVEIVDATDEVRRMLEGVSAEQVFERSVWPQLVGFAEIRMEGDVLPLRAEYDTSSNHNIGINIGVGGERLWYPLPELVASKLATGKAPDVVRAFRLVPHGQQAGLKPVKLRGAIEIDPRREDFFQRVIEHRKRVRTLGLAPEEARRLDKLLKILANAGGYGIFAEMNAQDLPKGKKRKVTVHGRDRAFEVQSTKPESPGLFCFPLISACITSGARLMLALLEHEVTRRGGSYVLCDTDSMAVVASETGGLVPCENGPYQLPHGRPAVRALGWAEVDDIVAKFEALNPYDCDIVPGSVLEVEAENFVDGERRQLYSFAISAKRYVLYNQDPDGRIVIRKPLEHGLGHLVNPKPDQPADSWIEDVWLRLIAEGAGAADLGPRPAWFDRPAVSRLGVTSPELLRPFDAFNQGKDYADQIKPFNFMLSAHVMPLGHPVGADPQHFHLIAPYSTDSATWIDLPWIDMYSRKRVSIYTGINGPPDAARLRTYGDVVDLYACHPEVKSADAEGRACTRRTIGLLNRRIVRPISIDYVGKESNRLDEVDVGLIHDPGRVREVYAEPEPEWWADICAQLQRIPARILAEALHCSKDHIKAVRTGRDRPSRHLVRRIVKYLAIEGAA